MLSAELRNPDPSLMALAYAVENAKISDALKMEAARHAAAVENMHRLRALRLARDAKQSTKSN